MDFEKLGELLKGAHVTFSKYCISGLVSDCKCRRCLERCGETSTPDTEEAARIRSEIESKKFRQSLFSPRE